MRNKVKKEELVKKEESKNIVVRLGDLIDFFPNFQAFMALEKQNAKQTWELSFCFNSEIKPAIDNFNEVVRSIARQHEMNKPFKTELEGETPEQFKKRKLDRVEAKKSYDAEVAEIRRQEITLHISKINGAEFCEFVDAFNAEQTKREREEKHFKPQISLTFEMMIPWLFE